MANSLLGFIIEGAGFDVSKPGGLALHADFWDQPASSDFEWIDCMEARPQSVESTVNPYTGERQTSSYTMEVSRSDRLMILLFTEQRFASGVMISTAPTTFTTVGYDVSGLDGQVIWVGDEVILLGTYSSGVGYTGCTRGYWNTQPQYHAIGAEVYEDATPYWESRTVQLVSHDIDTGIETRRWRGVIEDINTSEDGERIIVQMNSLQAKLEEADVNLSSQNLASKLKNGVITGVSEGVSFTGKVSLQLDDQAAVVVNYHSARREFGSIAFPSSFALYGSYYSYQDGEAPETIYEICTLANFTDLAAPRHPLAIALALLTSDGSNQGVEYGAGLAGFKVLSTDWGLAVDYIDYASWEAEIAASSGLEIDRLVLGWNGEPVNVMSVINQKLLRPFGFFLTETQSGDIGVARLRLFDVRDVESALTNVTTIYPDGPLKWMRAFGTSYQQVVAVVGGTPWHDAREVTLRDASRSRRRALLGSSRDARIDYSVVDPDKLQVTGREDSELANALVNLLQLGLDAVPRVQVRVTDTEESDTLTSLTHGEVVRIESFEVDGGWAVSGGEVVEDIDDITFFGQVIGRTWSTDDHSYTVTLLLTNYAVKQYVRLRAPSARVTSYDGATQTITCEGQWRADGPGLHERFALGDQVVSCTRQGVVTSVVGTITDLKPAAMTTSPSIAPSAGEIIRLADSGDYSNDARYSITIRPYSYITVDSATFEDGDGDDSGPDVYGTQVYGGAS